MNCTNGVLPDTIRRLMRRMRFPASRHRCRLTSKYSLMLDSVGKEWSNPRSVTKVPLPACRSILPSLARMARACLTVILLMPYFLVGQCSVGIRSNILASYPLRTDLLEDQVRPENHPRSHVPAGRGSQFQELAD